MNDDDDDDDDDGGYSLCVSLRFSQKKAIAKKRDGN